MANSTWVVTGDLPDQYSTSGSSTPVLGHVIFFQTGAGNNGSIFVSNAQYTPALVKPAIQAQANVVDEINALVNKG
jgi:hypothetical protein